MKIKNKFVKLACASMPEGAPLCGKKEAEMSKRNGVFLIKAERDRHVKQEGWTAAHDDLHTNDELARAAACYALPHPYRMMIRLKHDDPAIPSDWPFTAQMWKPTHYDRIRELQKAGALIAAEIDRLLRISR